MNNIGCASSTYYSNEKNTYFYIDFDADPLLFFRNYRALGIQRNIKCNHWPKPRMGLGAGGCIL